MIVPPASRHLGGMALAALRPELLQAAIDGEVDARARVTEALLPEVVRWCVRLGGPRVDPEDAAHEVLITVLARLHGLRDPASFPAWTFQVTRRVLAQHRRRAWFRRWIPGASVDVAGEDPGAALLASDTSRRVQRLLEEIPAAQREVFVLCDLEQHTDVEVAQLLDLPVGTVKSRLRVARARFRELAIRDDLAPAPWRVIDGGTR